MAVHDSGTMPKASEILAAMRQKKAQQRALVPRTEVRLAVVSKTTAPVPRGSTLTRLPITIPAKPAPFIGVQIPGKRPFAVKSQMLKALLRDIEVTRFEVVYPGVDANRVLVIEHHTGRVRGKYKIVEPNLTELWKVQYAWAKRQRDAGPRSKGRQTARQKRIAALHKGLAKLLRFKPKNPCFQSLYYWFPYHELRDWYSKRAERQALPRAEQELLKGTRPQFKGEGLEWGTARLKRWLENNRDAMVEIKAEIAAIEAME